MKHLIQNLLLQSKNYILIFGWLFTTLSVFSQTSICTDFNTGSTDNWNEQLSNISINSPSLDGSEFLLIKDDFGTSWAYNNDDFDSGLLLELHCLCFDYKVFSDGQSGSVNINPTVTLYLGSDPNSATLQATFTFTSTTVTENSEWVHVCVPTTLCTGNTLPVSPQGSWAMSSGTSCTDFNNLLSNGQIAFSADIPGSTDGAIIGIDNVCLQDCDDDQPQDETDYCCDSDINEITNGNFESGNTGFTSAYSLGSNSLYGTVPDQYYVGTNADGLAISPFWNVNDHSFCSIGSANDEVLFVNGKTTQPSGTESVIYEQNVVFSDPQVQKQYKFCANFKNMPQATFDIIPRIDIRVNGISQTGGFVALNNTVVSDPCSWELVGFDFVAAGSVNVQVFLKEDGLGDGNDLAIDDISLQEMMDPEYSITVQHQGGPQVITGSLNTIDTSDDMLLCENATGQADYYWFVIEVTNFTGGSLTFDTSTLGWGNTTGSFVTTPFGSGVGSPWNLTTTYPGYPFDQDTLYLVGLYTPANPDCCLSAGWTYQLTFNHRNPSNGILTAKQKEELKALFGVIPQDSLDREGLGQRLTTYPNPATDFINIDIKNQDIKSYIITNTFGRVLSSKEVNNNETLKGVSVAHLPQGVYFLSITNEKGIKTSTKFIKK